MQPDHAASNRRRSERFPVRGHIQGTHLVGGALTVLDLNSGGFSAEMLHECITGTLAPVRLKIDNDLEAVFVVKLVHLLRINTRGRTLFIGGFEFVTDEDPTTHEAIADFVNRAISAVVPHHVVG